MNVLGYKLDKYQQTAVENCSNNILLLAGAGSGKTLTIIGKIKYLIEIKQIKESEILCLSLTNEAVNNLKNKLKNYYNYNIEVETFHKLALNIIRKTSEIKICPDNLLKFITEEYLTSIILNNDKMITIVLSIYNKRLVFNKKKSYKRFLKYKGINKLKKLIIKFINLYKTNYNDYTFLNTLYKKENKHNKKIIILIYKIMRLYEEEKNSQNLFDLNDILHTCIKKINKAKINYKYIIVDEYQDTSLVKYNILKALIDKTNAHIFAVGDDYQTIFSFTGCDINIFLNFKKCFSNSLILTIPNIYRNSKEIIHIAKTFIEKNKLQMKKNLISEKTINKPIKYIYTNNEKKTLEILEKNLEGTLIVLSRNNYNLLNKISNDKIKYLTIHKAKGLEADNIIIINNKNDIMGFPNKIKENKLLKHLLTKETYPYEEERRLMYVALTRTKNNVYFLINRNNKSMFIREIEKDYKEYIEVIALQKAKKGI